MYNELYNLLQQHIYGLDAVLTGDQTLTLTILATTGCIFLVSLPFIIVWKVVRGR